MAKSGPANPLVALTVTLFLLIIFAAACSGAGSFNPLPSLQLQSPGIDAKAIDSAISPAIRDPERSILRLAMAQTMIDFGLQWNVKLNSHTQFIVVFEEPNRKVYANQLGLAASVRHLEQVPGSQTLFTDSLGRITVLPDDRDTEAALEPATSQTPIPVQTGQGPYRRIISTAGFNGGQTVLDLPAPSTSHCPPGRA